jgi:hypothetical protein
MPNHDVGQAERVRQHVRRIMDQLTRHQRSQGNNGLAPTAGDSSTTFFDPKTGKTVIIKTKPPTKT